MRGTGDGDRRLVYLRGRGDRTSFRNPGVGTVSGIVDFTRWSRYRQFNTWRYPTALTAECGRIEQDRVLLQKPAIGPENLYQEVQIQRVYIVVFK